ncbi:DUF6883 domain-containing protein [Gloeobacter violaceus]|uniref:DUF6883 domain-containing protein n=1 Tax=Gloeobacter violaceus TaxID=33072 RepID=UPI0018D31549|nr:DUF6883 domain-containing protein [Gloeobacter violaceus]
MLAAVQHLRMLLSMEPLNRFEFPLAKAEYLLNYTTASGKGGDKQNFWRVLMGFDSAVEIQAAILAQISSDLLQLQSQNDFGVLYRAYLRLTGPSGLSRRIRTIWIVRFEESVARFVTAVPQRTGESGE